MKLTVLESIIDARTAGVAAALVTDLGSGDQLFFALRDGAIETASSYASEPELESIVRGAIANDRSRIHELAGRQRFVQVFNPPLRMIVIGAAHIAQALVPIAITTGFQVTVVDPRTAFASEQRFPGTTLNHDWPDDALHALKPDHRSAIITLSHDPKIDDPALEVALRTSAFYIGSLGSKRTHAARLERLREQGFDDEVLARIHAPIGLDIHAQSTAEIAVAIVGEVVKVLRQRQ